MHFPKTARAAIDHLLDAIQARDVEAALAVYEEDATLAVMPGALAKGKAAIRAFFEGFFGLGNKVRHEMQKLTEAENLALFTSTWMVFGPTLPGVPRENVRAIVLKKHRDGRWLIAIDNPWGPSDVRAGRGALSRRG